MTLIEYIIALVFIDCNLIACESAASALNNGYPRYVLIYRLLYWSLELNFGDYLSKSLNSVCAEAEKASNA